MDYDDFNTKIEKFFLNIEDNLTNLTDDVSEMLTATVFRRIFAVYDNDIKKTSIMVEINTNILNTDKEKVDQSFLANILQNMIKIFSYILELQQKGFLLDILPEEGIWYASILLQSSNVEREVYNLLYKYNELL